jgi:hypothetical protein
MASEAAWRWTAGPNANTVLIWLQYKQLLLIPARQLAKASLLKDAASVFFGPRLKLITQLLSGGVTGDEVWIGNWIHCTLTFVTTNNCDSLSYTLQRSL